MWHLAQEFLHDPRIDCEIAACNDCRCRFTPISAVVKTTLLFVVPSLISFIKTALEAINIAFQLSSFSVFDNRLTP